MTHGAELVVRPGSVGSGESAHLHQTLPAAFGRTPHPLTLQQSSRLAFNTTLLWNCAMAIWWMLRCREDIQGD